MWHTTSHDGDVACAVDGRARRGGADRVGMTRACQGCDTTFLVGPHEHNPRRWCSEACRVWSLRHPGQRRPLKRYCQQCGTGIDHTLGRSLYCTSRCCELAKLDRRRRYPLPATCACCGEQYEQRNSKQATCSKTCYMVLYRLANPDKYPSWNAAKKAAWQRRRALKAGATAERVVATDIYERDGWTCQLCGHEVDADLPWPSPMSASLDHCIPLSKGGEHMGANTQLAHLVCNVAKRDRLVP